ncbi:MAG TPA: hypothetical protein VMZ33_08255 [Candidatus Limnocylindrales bacterium]|nr:hypothetical protein [Candidatus Limnocylindrales bacterium]
MADEIRDLVRDINRQQRAGFEERLRRELISKDRAWLVDQLVALALADRERRLGTAHDSESDATEEPAERTERAKRVRELRLNTAKVRAFAATHEGVERARLIASGHLAAEAPGKGTDLLTSAHRGPSGDQLLDEAKDMLFGLLFGDDSTDTRLDRVQQELLTIALPRGKANALDFMRASTELSAAGTWQDPDSVSNDARAENVLIEVEFGETADEVVGAGIVAALSVINNLEINEQVLYARMINVEESTLIS